MILARFAPAFALGLAVSCTAVAHDPIPNANWCAHGVLRYTGEFAFTRDELVSEIRRRQHAAVLCTQDANRPTPASGGDSTCGVFDPPYEAARSIARTFCGASDSDAPAQLGDIVAVVETPTSFDAADHHTSFTIDAGISGMCGVCIPIGAISQPIVPGGNN